MARMLFALTLLFLTTAPAWAAEADIAAHPECRYCAMDRQQFAHSRMLIRYQDGSQTATCSLRCAAVELAAELGKQPSAIEVGDYHSNQLIDAEWAYWVVGGSKAGVMSQRAKWAFAKRQAAEEFIAAHGGTLVGFEEALEAAYADLYQDSRALRQRRQNPAQKPGQGHEHHSPPATSKPHQGHHHQ